MSSAKGFYKAGVEAFKAGDRDRARQMLQESLEIDKSNPYAWLWYSRTQRDPQKALKSIERAIRLDPDNKTARKMKAKLLKSQQQAKVRASKPVFPETPGKRLAVVGTRMSQHVVHFLLVIFVGSFTLITASVTYNMWNGITDSTDSTEVAISGFLALLTIMFAFVTLVFAYEILGTFGAKIVLHENGFTRSTGKNARYFLWQDFDTIKFRDSVVIARTRILLFYVPVFKYVRYKVALSAKGKNGLVLSHNFHNFRTIGSEIMKRAVPVIARKYVAELMKGESIRLAGINIDNQGIYKSGNVLAWRDISYIEVLDPESDENDKCTLAVNMKDGRQITYGKNSAEPNLYVIPALTHAMLMQNIDKSR